MAIHEERKSRKNLYKVTLYGNNTVNVEKYVFAIRADDAIDEMFSIIKEDPKSFMGAVGVVKLDFIEVL